MAFQFTFSAFTWSLRGDTKGDSIGLTLCGKVERQQCSQYFAKVLSSVEPLWFKSLVAKKMTGKKLLD